MENILELEEFSRTFKNAAELETNFQEFCLIFRKYFIKLCRNFLEILVAKIFKNFLNISRNFYCNINTEALNSPLRFISGCVSEPIDQCEFITDFNKKHKAFSRRIRFVWVLWHINRSRLFNAKSIFMKIVLFQTIQFSISTQFNFKYSLIVKKTFYLKLFSWVKQFSFKQFSLA